LGACREGCSRVKTKVKKEKKKVYSPNLVVGARIVGFLSTFELRSILRMKRDQRKKVVVGKCYRPTKKQAKRGFAGGGKTSENKRSFIR